MANVPAPLPPSTANWHWKNKNVTRWSRDWFEQELLSISVTGINQGEVVSVSSIVNVDGDVELGQRKSKYVSSIVEFLSTIDLYCLLR
jgi:activator of HSP90 ATPase